MCQHHQGCVNAIQIDTLPNQNNAPQQYQNNAWGPTFDFSKHQNNRCEMLPRP